MDLRNALQTEALNLGFSLFGVTSADPPQSLPVFMQWLEKGNHGSMGYLATERAISRRANPGMILPGARTIILLGFPYPGTGSTSLSKNTGLVGRVAAYAWGRDYHDVIPPRLDQLIKFLQELAPEGISSRGYTDTGPILERDLASRAGLGWIGKNSCLINPKTGSIFLLAAILTTLELNPDPPFQTEHCGSCQRCIESCPTGCILPDRTIDARRCISYLTIENKGKIPVEIRPKLSNWVFGCDVCQQVCPWNIRFATDQRAQELEPDPNNVSPELVQALELTPEEFKRRFNQTPISRAKRRGFLRNVAVALGNSHSTAAIPVLIKTLIEENEPLVRAHAAWALGEIGTQVAFNALKSAQINESDLEVIVEIQAALEKLNYRNQNNR